MMITPITNNPMRREITTFKISLFLNPSRKLRIKNNHDTNAKNGTTNVIAQALTKEFNALAYLKAKNVVATVKIEKHIPKMSATS